MDSSGSLTAAGNGFLDHIYRRPGVAADFRLNDIIQSNTGLSKNPFCHAERSSVLGRTDRGNYHEFFQSVDLLLGGGL